MQRGGTHHLAHNSSGRRVNVGKGQQGLRRLWDELVDKVFHSEAPPNAKGGAKKPFPETRGTPLGGLARPHKPVKQPA
ncbi:hypothetical protein GCM10019060_12490 [Novosphingobium pokkalii]|nr:hypothetical protein GCM10019060_12490 [Novosphingobium pokkalii]